MEQSSIVLTDEFRFLYLHHTDIKRFFNTGFLAEFSDIRYMQKYPDYKEYTSTGTDGKYDWHKNGWKRKIENQNIKKMYELDSLERYQWEKKYSDYAVYESISFFIELIDYANTNNASKQNIYSAIHKSIEIVNYQKYIYDKKDISSIFIEIDNIFYFICNSFGIKRVYENFIDNIYSLFGELQQTKVLDETFIEKLYNNTQLLREIRNFFIHDEKNEARFFNHIDFKQFIKYQLYLFILISDILKNNFTQSIEINAFFSSYDTDNEKHKLRCTINDKINYLKPFKTHNGLNKIDLTCQRAIIKTSGNDFEIKKKSYEIAPRITSEDLAKQLKDENKKQFETVITLLNDTNNISENLQKYRQEILENLNKGNQDFATWATNINEQILKLTALSNKTDKQTEAIKEQVTILSDKTDKQTEAIKEQVTVLSKKTDEQAEAIKEQVTILSDKTDKQTEEFKRIITHVIEKIKGTICSGVKNILIFILSCIVLFGAYLGVKYALNKHAESLFHRTGYEFFLQKAHTNGAHDLAYEHALFLEKEGKVKEACYWYAKAKERYAEIVSINPDDSEAAYRLAQMLIRLKGGSDNLMTDYQKALYYAKIAAKDYGYGLYVYINLIIGHESEACQAMLEIEDGNSIQDDYSELAHILMQLHNIGDKEPLHTQDKVALLDKLGKMCVEANNDARQEAMIQWYNLSMNGLKMNGTYIMGCDFYEAEALVRQNMENVPLLVTYLTYADLNNNYSLLEQVLERLWQNGTRFAYPQLHDLIRRKMTSEPSYMKELNANIIQTDSLSVFEAARRYNLHIRHNHLREETLGYIQYADSLAALNPMLIMDKKTLLISFLVGEDSISVKDLEALPFVPEKSEALCNYLMGIKYAKGYGSKKDMERADSYFMAAADTGLGIARYTWAIRLYKQGKIIPAIRMLKPLAEKWDNARIWLAYMMKDLDPQSFEEYLGQVENQYHPYVTAAMSARLVETGDQESFKLIHFNLRNSIGESMGCPEKIAVLAGYLSQITSRATIDESLFYAYWAINSEKEIGYQFFPGLAEWFKLIERPDLAERLIKDMCMAYFRKDGSVLDDKNKEAVISLLRNEYPHLVNQIAAEIGYNPVTSVDLNKNRKEFIEPDFSMILLPDECVLDLLNE